MADFIDSINNQGRYARDVVTISEPDIDASEVETLAQHLAKEFEKIQNTVHKRQQELNKKQAQEIANLRLKYDKAGIVWTKSEELKAIKKIEAEKQKEQLKTLTEYYSEARRQEEELEKARSDLRKAKLNSGNGSIKDLTDEMGYQAKQKMSNAVNSVMQTLDKALNNMIGTYSEYQRNINTRLQGTDENFYKLQNKLNLAVGVQPWIKNEKLMQNLNALTEQGIAYNLEQRAFLMTVSENIAKTFDAANASLLRIVKLQQSDSTAARLGLEVSVQKYLNAMFENTEYLNTNFDNVTSALLEASSQMDAERALEFEYIAQKWLGSLSSVGLSDNAVSSIASALGNLGSGNITGLQGNAGMQNLVVMATSKAGLDYATLLADGLDASNTNKLMNAMVAYLQEIAENENQ